MRIRKNARYLTDDEKNVFLRAVLTLKAQPMPGVPGWNRYDYFVLMHYAATRVVFDGSSHNMAHGTAMFLPWHREYCLQFENALRATIPGVTDEVTLPYWDWGYVPPMISGGRVVDNDLVLRMDFLGGNGGVAESGGVAVLPSGGSMQTGWFTYNAPASPPPWWPAGLAGWRIPNRMGVPVVDDSGTQALNRTFGSSAAPVGAGSVNTSMSQTTYAAFRSHLEGASHAVGHNWFNGHMSNPSRSPSDPMFFLHHANIDRLWALWQIHGTATDTYDGAALDPYRLNDPMWPWGWADGSFALNTWNAALPVPDHSADPVRRPADMLDHRALGYRYDSEVVLGIALDRSRSMEGPTPDPMTGAPPNLRKWDVAVSGVQNLLQDCAVAFASREAYVTAGVLVFGTGGGGGIETIPVWPAPGVVKATGTHSASGFVAALGATVPAGGTPLATAVTQTETSLVRAPYPTSLPDDPRFMSFLTDGIETAGPLLSSIPDGTYAATRIFAMGFGIGSGWDGVNYTGIQDIVDKGAPAVAGVNQVFHGENGGELDKFYADTITRALDFRQSTDPLYELALGEHVHTPFTVNASDDAFLITVQGFDYDDARWRVELIAPDGTVYAAADREAPVRLDVLRRRGRTSMMLKRGASGYVGWVGTWQVRTTRTRPHAAGEHVHHETHEMFMPELWSLLRHAGAPRPFGPIYGGAGVKRVPERFTPDPVALSRLKLKLADVRVPRQFVDVCAVAVNISHRGRVRTSLAGPSRPITAGQVLDIGVLFEGVDLRHLDDVVIAGRVVAPAFSLGNLLADVRTVPLGKRVLDHASGGIDLHRFLVDHEKAAGRALPIRDEEVRFDRDASGGLRARIATQHPGIHYVSVYLEATDTRSPTRERIQRILATEVPVGLRLDPRRSAPKLKATRTAIEVTFTPTDHLGNIAAPSRRRPAQVVIGGMTVDATVVPSLGAERVLTVPLYKGSDHGLGSAHCVACADGTMRAFDAGKPVGMQVFWGGAIVASGPAPAPHDHDHDHDHAPPPQAKKRKKR